MGLPGRGQQHQEAVGPPAADDEDKHDEHCGGRAHAAEGAQHARVGGQGPHAQVRQAHGPADVVVAEAHEQEGQQVAGHHQPHAVGRAQLRGVRGRPVQVAVEALRRRGLPGSTEQLPGQGEAQRRQPGAGQQLQRAAAPDLLPRRPHDGAVAVQRDEGHAERGHDPEAPAEEAAGGAKAAPGPRGGGGRRALGRREEVQEGGWQAEQRREQIRQRQGQDGRVGDGAELPVLHDHPHHRAVVQARQQEDEQEDERLGRHRRPLR